MVSSAAPLQLFGTPPVTPPPPPEPPLPPPENIITLTSANTKADFQAACNNLSYDAIELTAGNYTWKSVTIDVDRTSRPLIIRPVAGATVNFIGDGTTIVAIFYLGYNVLTKWITFDGTAGAIIFKNFTLAASGVFQPGATEHCTFRKLTFQNLGRDPVYAANPYNTWCFYIAVGAGNVGSSDLLITQCTFSVPSVAYNISAVQVASTGSHGAITVSNCTFDRYAYVWYGGRPMTFATLDTWTVTDCGNPGGAGNSIRFTGPFLINGIYKNIVATSSGNYLDDHTGGGTITNGGGNSGI